MMWLQGEERKGTLAGIGLDCGLYARVCPIYHECDKKKDLQAFAQQDEPDASL
jgi:hypothetical protein